MKKRNLVLAFQFRCIIFTSVTYIIFSTSQGRFLTMQQAKRGLSPSQRTQRRSYLNLYPKPDSGTANPSSFAQFYYRLPDYATHKDHKQVRDPKLDKSNTDELTRDEERRQRTQIMSWRKEMEEKGEPESLPKWNSKDEHDLGLFREHWSGAQLLEYYLRSGRIPQNLPSAEEEKAKVDPHGILSSDNPLDVAFKSLPHYKPGQMSFRQAIPPHELQQLSSRYQRLTSSQFSVNGFDFPEIVENLSKSLRTTGSFLEANKFLSDLCEATASGYACDELLQQLKINTKIESKYEWFSAEFNHRIQPEELLTDEALPKLADAYSEGGPKGFWEALINEHEIDPSFKSHLKVFLNLSKDEILSTLTQIEHLYGDYAAILEKRYNRLVSAGNFDPTNPILKAKLVLSEVQEWALKGDSSGEKKDDDDDWEIERLDIQSIMDKNISPTGKDEIPLSEWLRWHFIDQFILPQKLDVYEPELLLAARFANLPFYEAVQSLISDHISHIRTVFEYLYTSTSGSVPFYQFLRCLINCSNIPNYNLNMTTSFFNAQKAMQRYLESGSFSKEIISSGDEDVTDLSAQIAELFLKNRSRDWSNSNSSSNSREQIRKDASAWAIVRQLRLGDASYQNQNLAIDLVKSHVKDIETCVGILRRKATAEMESELNSGSEEHFEIKNVKITTENNTAEGGKQYEVTWDWTPSSVYGVSKPSLEKKEQIYADYVSSQTSAANRISDDNNLIDDVMTHINSIDGTDEMDDNRTETRREWAVVKSYHKHLQNKALKEIEVNYEVENEYPVHVVLLKQSDDSLLTELIDSRENINAISQSNNPEDLRLHTIIDNVGKYIVNSHLEKSEHLFGSDEVATRLAESIANGTLSSLTSSTDKLSDAIKVDSWDAVKVLKTSSNTGSTNIVLPLSQTGQYKIAIYSDDFAKVGESEVFSINTNMNQYVDEYIKSQRSGKPPLSELDGKRVLLIPEEVPEIIKFLKTKGIYFTLQSETELGSDIIGLASDIPQSSGTMPFVHIDVLKYQLANMFSTNPNSPIDEFISRNAPLLKQFWEIQNPGSSMLEWIKSKPSLTEMMTSNSHFWFAYDRELLETAAGDRSQYLDTKIANLATNGGTPLATAQYEGTGYVSSLVLNEDIKRMRVPLNTDLTSDSTTAIQFTDRLNDQIVEITETDSSLHLSVQGSKEVVTSVRFNERRWGLELGETVCV